MSSWIFSVLIMMMSGSSVLSEDVGPNLTGHWKLNEELSDSPPARRGRGSGGGLRGGSGTGGGGGTQGGLGQGRRGGGTGGGRGSAGGPRRPMPTEFEIAHEGDTLRVQSADGRAQTVNTTWTEWQQGAYGDVRAFWKEQKVQVERRREGGPTLSTTYTINPDGRLVITTQLPRGDRTMTRVYDRVED